MLGLAGPVRGSSIYMMALLKAVSLLDSLVAMVVGSVRRGVWEQCWPGPRTLLVGGGQKEVTWPPGGVAHYDRPVMFTRSFGEDIPLSCVF